MVAPQGLQLCWEDPRAAQALHFVAAVDANKPHAAIYENVYSFWALMGAGFDKLMAAIGYVPMLPGKTPRIEFFRATEHGSCLWRDRIHRHYEPAKIELGNLAEVTKSKLYAEPQRLQQHLLPAGEVPEGAFPPGEFKRLKTPRRAKDEDPYSPLIVATLTTKPEDKVTEGSRVRIRGSGDPWSVLEIGQHTVKLMRDDRLNPTTVEVEKIEVSAHLARTVNVHDASRLMSPRTFGQDTPNMIVERPSHPGRASHVLVTEAASAMGVTVDPRLPREQQQRHVGNAIVDVMADAISARVVDRASVAAAKLAPSATMAPMISQHEHLRRARLVEVVAGVGVRRRPGLNVELGRLLGALQVAHASKGRRPHREPSDAHGVQERRGEINRRLWEPDGARWSIDATLTSSRQDVFVERDLLHDGRGRFSLLPESLTSHPPVRQCGNHAASPTLSKERALLAASDVLVLIRA